MEIYFKKTLNVFKVVLIPMLSLYIATKLTSLSTLVDWHRPSTCVMVVVHDFPGSGAHDCKLKIARVGPPSFFCRETQLRTYMSIHFYPAQPLNTVIYCIVRLSKVELNYKTVILYYETNNFSLIWTVAC